MLEIGKMYYMKAIMNRKEQNLIFKKDAQMITDKWANKSWISLSLVMRWISNCYMVQPLLIAKTEGECRRVCCIARPLVAGHPTYVTLSGKTKYQGKTHPSLWGSSRVKGRPRNVCAEFKCANQILQAGSQLEQYEICVFQLTDGKARDRCANCVLVTQACKCLTD
jgi:hypothetical protein